MNPKEFRAMKKVFSLCLVLITLNSNSQTPIDYDNFDSDLASKILGQKFIEFRDTINAFGSGRLFSENYPETVEYPELKIPRWSDYLYENLSKYNCGKMMENKRHESGHIDREKWFKSQQTKSDLGEIMFKGTIIPKSKWEVYTICMEYSENSCSLQSQFNTYEELALYMINGYENSIMHRCAQRGIMHDVTVYRSYGVKIYGLFSCCIMYDKETKITKSVLNMVN